jgi:hypothetical protein
MRQIDMMEPPRHRDEARLVRAGREGVYWQAHDGLRVHLASAEREGDRVPKRSGRSVGWEHDEASAPEGALAFLVAAPRAAEVVGGRADTGVRAAGLLMALWMRLFADTA